MPVYYSLTERGKAYLANVPEPFAKIMTKKFRDSVEEVIDELVPEEDPYHKIHKESVVNPT